MDPSNIFYPDYTDGYNWTFNSRTSGGNMTNNYSSYYAPIGMCMHALTIVICFFGIMGNGTVIWLLAFSIPRNPFTTLILNLAAADFGVLLLIPLIIILYRFHLSDIFFPYFYLEDIFMYMYTPGQFLLTAISVDRCVSVHFPIWHRCHRSERFSAIVCAIIWVVSFILCGIPSILLLIDANRYHVAMAYLSIPIALLCFPLMIISTFSLFIKVCLKPTQHQRGNILTVVLLALLFFIIFAFPFNIFFCGFYFSNLPPFPLSTFGFLCASLNSSVNPLIYFLVGRQKRGKCRENMKVILYRVFNEEKECRSQLDP